MQTGAEVREAESVGGCMARSIKTCKLALKGNTIATQPRQKKHTNRALTAQHSTAWRTGDVFICPLFARWPPQGLPSENHRFFFVDVRLPKRARRELV
jgi:hypothetical protein